MRPAHPPRPKTVMGPTVTSASPTSWDGLAVTGLRAGGTVGRVVLRARLRRRARPCSDGACARVAGERPAQGRATRVQGRAP